MNNNDRRIVTFFGIYQVLKAERLLKKEGLPVESIAVPRHITSDCGICIRFNRSDEERVRATITAANIETRGYYDE
jgi:hypothetical protein